MSTLAKADTAYRPARGLFARIKRSVLRQDSLWAYVFLAPVLVHHAVFVVYPVFYSLRLSLYDWNGLSPTMRYVGLANYRALFADAEFAAAVLHTLIYTAGLVGGVLVLALAAALVFDRRMRGGNFFRVTYYTPAVTSGIVVAVIWSWMYHPNFGTINLILREFGIQGPAWISSPDTALVSVIITGIWGAVGYYAVIYLAGLQGIDRTYYEAATIDGADSWQSFWHVTLPLLKPTITYVVVMLMIVGSQVFGLIYAMTNGGPVGSTTVVVYLLYRQAFEFYKFGYASTTAYVLFAIMLVMTIVQFKLLSQDTVEY